MLSLKGTSWGVFKHMLPNTPKEVKVELNEIKL